MPFALPRFGVTLALVNLALASLYIVDQVLGSPSLAVRRVLNLDGEATIPAWYTSSLLLLAAAGLLSAGRMRLAGAPPRMFFVLFASALIFLSADEVVALHEQMRNSLRGFEALPRFSGDHGIWIPFYITAGVAFIGITYKGWRDLWRTQRRAAGYLASGLALLAAGGIGLEIVSYGDLRTPQARELYVVFVVLEELLEMFGATALLVGARSLSPSHMATTMPSVQR